MVTIMLMSALCVALAIFFVRIMPNLRKPKWKRKLVAADYLRVRDRASLADDVIIETIKEFPNIPQLYINLFDNYAEPSNMKKIYSVMEYGARKTDNPGVVMREALCLMEEGEFEKAEKSFLRKDVENYMLEYGLPYLALLYFKQGKYRECDKVFTSFYRALYDTIFKTETSTKKSKNKQKEPDETEIFADLSPEELVILISARKKIDKEWKTPARIIPAESIHEEKSWKGYCEKLEMQKEKLIVEAGIYGPPENLKALREKELDERLETAKLCISISQ